MDIKYHKILFEDRKSKDSERQLTFNGVPFVVLGQQLLDCIHGKDHKVCRKEKLLKQKENMKVCFSTVF